MYQEAFHIKTSGRGTQNISQQIQNVVRNSGIQTGLCHVFVKHTSASLIICENADPDVRSDLEDWLTREVQDGDPRYRHSMEGPDDMAAHIRSILTKMDQTLPVTQGRLALGTWQGLFLYEHRYHGHQRSIVVTVSGS
jgi:secondary thiamine-phosphate synthase enzyme